MDAQLDEMLKNELKFSAKKKLYFALAVMFSRTHQNLSRTTKALEALNKAIKEGCECGECASHVPEMMPKMLEDQFHQARAMYCVTDALKSYKQAFGEYPEFARFVAKNHEMGQIDEVVRVMELAVDRIDAQLKDMHKRMKKMAKPGESVPEHPCVRKDAFGKEFESMASALKLKGER